MLTRIAFGLTLILSVLMASSSWGTPIPGSVLWLDATDIDGDGIAGNNPGLLAPVSSWVDKASALGSQTATQASGALQPKYVPNFQNGQSAVEFTNDILDTSSFGLGAFTIFSAFRSNAGQTLLIERGPNVNSSPGEYQATSTGSTIAVRRGTTNSQKEYTANWASSATLLTSTQTFNGTHASHLFHVNGNSVALSNAVIGDPGLGVENAALHIGARVGQVVPLAGHVAEMIVYNSALNAASVNIVNNYLSSKYDSPMAANDKYSGDTAGNGNYDFDVFGIGRESDGTISNGSYGSGLTLTEESASLAVGEYVLAGHKTAVNSTNPDGTWARVWYLDKTETTGIDASLTFDFSDAGLGTPSFGVWTSLTLVYSPTDPFSFNSLGIAGTTSGDSVSFLVPNAQLLDGYYTLQAVTVPEPSTLALLGLGIVGLAVKARRRRNEA